MRKLVCSILLIIAVIVGIYAIFPQKTAFQGNNSDFLNKLTEYRIKNNLNILTETVELEKVAEAKCVDMVDRNYFSHTTPEGFYVWETFNHKSAGENLAEGYTNVDTTFEAWVNSATHNENLLKPEFTQVGHHTCFNGTSYLTVQVFKGE